MVLVVTAPFGAYQRGDTVDAAEAGAVLASENATRVVSVLREPQPTVPHGGEE